MNVVIVGSEISSQVAEALHENGTRNVVVDVPGELERSARALKVLLHLLDRLLLTRRQ